MASDTFSGTGNLTAPWTVVSGSFNQTGGACYGNVGATSSYAVNTTDGVIGDQDSEITLNPSGSGQFFGPCVRGSSSAFTCGAVDAGSDGVYVSTWAAGTQTLVAGPLTPPAAGTLVKLRAEGATTLRLYYAGVEQVGLGSPFTAAGLPASGYYGVVAYSNGTTTGAADWTGTDLNPPPTGPSMMGRYIGVMA